MERFIFNLAIVFAVMAAIVIGIGGHIHIDMGDAFGMDPVVHASAGRVAAQSYAGDSVEVKHTAAHIIVTPEDRQDISIEIDNPGRTPMPTVSRESGGKVVIDGHLRGRVGDCRDDGMNVVGYGSLSIDQLPQITIHTPRDVKIDLSGGNSSEIGAAQSVDASVSGCGQTTVADVAQTLKANISGSGNLTAGAAQNLDLDVAGSGHATIGAVRAGADISIAGSGLITIASLTGNLKANAEGSGDMNIQNGDIQNAHLEVAGSGNTQISAAIQSLDGELAGSGGLNIDHGPVTEAHLEVAGSSHAQMGGPIQHLNVEVAGSGSVQVGAPVHDLDAEIAGSGTIRVPLVTGQLNKQIMGSGDVIVGR